MAESNQLAAVGDTNTTKLPKTVEALAVMLCLLNLGGAVGAVITYEYSGDDGVNWFLLACTPLEGGAAATTRNAAGCSQAIIGGATHVRQRLSALTSGGPVLTRNNEVDY